jgi:hypothetical protein
MASNDLDVCIAATGVVGRIDLLDQLLRTKAATLIITTDHNAFQSLKKMPPYQRKNANSRFIVLPSDLYNPTATKLAERVASVLSFIADTAQ